MPVFPDFKPIALEDRDAIRGYFSGYQPETSELTFTNLFIWRGRYRYRWAELEDCLVVMGQAGENDPFFLPPVGPSSRKDVVRRILRWLGDEKKVKNARIERADARLAAEVNGADDIVILPVRDDFDYVYRREDLAKLAGRKYHSKRNHIHRIDRDFEYAYRPISGRLIIDCLRLTRKWCDWRDCRDKPDIRAECEAVHEAMMRFEALGLSGGAIYTDDDVRAFAVGEMLNDETFVVHVEKADPDFPQFYAVINQQIAEHVSPDAVFMNREQDLGNEGLRKAKLSYYPERLVEKYRIRLA